MAKTKTGRYKDFGRTTIVEDFPPITFSLNEEDFSCRPAMAGAALLDFVRRADSNSGGAAADAIIEFLEKSLEEEDRDRFTTLIRDDTVIVEVETLGEIAAWLIEQYTTRPTKPRSRSANGHGSSGRGSTDNSSEEE